MLLYNHSLYSSCDGGVDLVRDGLEDLGLVYGGWLVSEDGYDVSDFDIFYRGYVYHAHIHADVADGRNEFAVNAELGGSSAEVAVDAVCIAERKGGNL